MVNNNNKLKERGVSFFVPLMKKGEYLVWFLCVFFNVGGGSSSRVSVGFHRQALSSKRATSLVHQTQRKYCGLVSFALLVTTVSFRNQSVIAVAVEQEIEGAVSWLLASAAVHFMGYDALHACMEHLSTFIYACMDVKIVGNQSSCMGGMEGERERERECLDFSGVYGHASWVGFDPSGSWIERKRWR
ncbi:hypothetical protein Peur_000855 [Populus x canadensis]